MTSDPLYQAFFLIELSLKVFFPQLKDTFRKAITLITGNTKLFVTYQLKYLRVAMVTVNPHCTAALTSDLRVFLTMLSEIHLQKLLEMT